MPKIERSVDYTFEAYSGLEDGDQCVRSSSKLEDEQLEENSVAEMDDSSDMDNSKSTNGLLFNKKKIKLIT